MKESIIYILVFSFLLAGCYTTDSYIDSPQNIISGRSKIKLKDDFVLDSLILKDGKILNFKDSFSEFLDCNKDGCSKLIVGKTIRLIGEKPGDISSSSNITYKKLPLDTIEVSKISLMHFSNKHINYTPIIIGSLLIVGVVVLLIEIQSAFNNSKFKF
ncbi:MAG: hypothetical protein PHN88_01760 [Ignavibacteria bacterium]|nr:hypothetical protein [Ignavibacteria bacterium]